MIHLLTNLTLRKLALNSMEKCLLKYIFLVQVVSHKFLVKNKVAEAFPFFENAPKNLPFVF